MTQADLAAIGAEASLLGIEGLFMWFKFLVESSP